MDGKDNAFWLDQWVGDRPQHSYINFFDLALDNNVLVHFPQVFWSTYIDPYFL